MTEEQDKYKQVVQQAEKAVSSVKDPELRRVAFEKILDQLLAGGASAPHSERRAKARVGKSTSKKGSAKRRGGATTYINEIAEEGFFKKPKTIAQVKAELENRGHHIPVTSLSGPLQSLCKNKTLRRQRTKDGDKKQTFSYSNW